MTTRITHPGRIIGAVRRSKDQLVPVRYIGLGQSLGSISTALLDIRQSRRRIFRLLTANVGLLGGGVNVGVGCAFEVGMLGEDEVEELIVVFVVKISED